MKSLRPNWFFEDLPDFEYKKYVLLAYLQDVHAQFTETLPVLWNRNKLFTIVFQSD